MINDHYRSYIIPPLSNGESQPRKRDSVIDATPRVVLEYFSESDPRWHWPKKTRQAQGLPRNLLPIGL